MSANTIIRINIMDAQHKSMTSNPDTVSWILTRPSATGQMADIVKFLNARNSAREGAGPTETARSMRAVYMLSDDEHGERTFVDAAAMSELVKKKGISGAAGGLRCEHGHVMKFVDRHTSKGSAVCAYFAHVTKSDESTGRAGHGGTGGTGRCSDVHLAAQLLIKNNISRIVATRFKSCGECTEVAFSAARRTACSARRNRGFRAHVKRPHDSLRRGRVRERRAPRLVRGQAHARDRTPARAPDFRTWRARRLTVRRTVRAQPTVRLKCENATA